MSVWVKEGEEKGGRKKHNKSKQGKYKHEGQTNTSLDRRETFKNGCRRTRVVAKENGRGREKEKEKKSKKQCVRDKRKRELSKPDP